ncbi:MAG: calcium-binding EGF-like domain-containing protein [Myxococcota bacterium]
MICRIIQLFRLSFLTDLDSEVDRTWPSKSTDLTCRSRTGAFHSALTEIECDMVADEVRIRPGVQIVCALLVCGCDECGNSASSELTLAADLVESTGELVADDRGCRAGAGRPFESSDAPCACWPGYGGSPDRCLDVDECATEEPCPSGAECVNTAGGFYCNCSANSCRSNVGWAISIGGSEEDSVNDVAVRDSSVAVVGTFGGQLPAPWSVESVDEFSDGFLTLFLNRARVSTTRLGGADLDRATAVTFTAGEILVTGEYREGFSHGARTLRVGEYGRGGFVAAFDVDGSPGWARDLERIEDQVEVFQVAAAKDGGIYVGGRLGGLSGLPFCSRFSSDGEHEWITSLPGDGYVASLAVESGEVVIAGRFEGSLTVGSTELASAGGTDGFLVWLDSEGRVQRGIRVGTSKSDALDAVALTADGAVAAGFFGGQLEAAGRTHTAAGEADPFVMWVEPTGSITRFQRIATSGLGRVMGVGARDDGMVVVTGSLSGELGTDPITDVGGATQGFVVVVEPGGAIRNLAVLRSASIAHPRALALDGRRAWVGGLFRGNLDYPGGRLATNGDADGFLVELALPAP